MVHAQPERPGRGGHALELREREHAPARTVVRVLYDERARAGEVVVGRVHRRA
jgi:hypothetical protein